MKRALCFLLFFSLVGGCVVLLWFSMMTVERASFPDLESVGIMPKRKTKRSVDVHDLAIDLPWDDAEKADELMRSDSREGVFWEKKNGPGASLVVFGSRKQAWVRGGGSDGVEFAVSALNAEPFQSSGVVPVSSRYSITLSLLSADDQVPPNWDPAQSGLEDLVQALSTHVQLRVSSQVRFFVDESMIHPHHWASDVTAHPLERPIDLVLYYRANATSFPQPFVISGAAGVAYDWKTAASVWREHLKYLLGFPRLSMAVEARFAPCVIPEWELELWSRGFKRRLEVSARKTLASLPKLLSSISGLPVTKETSEKLRIALDKLSDEPRMSWEIAEEIFFDQKSLPLLYFPPEHFLAVYAPVLFPPAFALLTGWIAMIKLWKGKQKKEKNE